MPLQTSLSRKELLSKCIQIVNTFDPKRTTVDAYVQDTDILKDKRIGEVETKFVHQVFYGCIRYQKFLKLFVTSFLYRCPTTAIRSDQTLYTILGYLLFFRLGELGVDEFREFLRCGHGTDSALLALMQYALDVEELEKWVKMEWCKLYDLTFVEEEVIGKLQGFREELWPIVEEVELKATGTVASAEGALEVSKRKTTKFEPFNLTKVRPRLIPEPEVINRQVKAQPVPSAIYKQSLAEIEEEKRQRQEEEKERIKAKYSVEEVPQLVTQRRKDKNELEELTKKVEAERYAECTFKPAPAKKYVPPTEEAVVRQNAAAVLREDALIRKKQQQEYDVLKRYEAELHDASGFYEWQQEQRLKDDMEEEARVRQRLVEMQISRVEAIEATKSCQRRKRILAEHQKAEVQGQMDRLKAEQEVELEDKKLLVQDTQEERERARQAELEVEKARAKNAEDIRRAKEEEQARKKREDEQEMERRRDLIRQIRALERVPIEKFKPNDRAEPPAHGLMEEMSYAELQERLKVLMQQKEQERESKRERQLAKKLEKQEELNEKAQDIAKVRAMAKDEASRRHNARRQKEEELEAKKAKYKEQCVEEAWARIEQKKKDKRAEELKLKKELQEIAVERQFRKAGAEAIEAKAHREQQFGLEREAKDRQRNLLENQRRANSIGAKDAGCRRANREKNAADITHMQEAVKDRLDRAKAADETLKADIRRANSAARCHQHTLEQRGRQEFGHSSNRYMQKLTARMGSATAMSISA
eukprot:TRINITY_DN37367_c0_g1_i1.p2 TRINITY_DN37367_c0_g1~~TRINITY_DN37367_c0_g1_i1.p2  ORF type:complete len:761 (-),score=288.59 TRINITY_DN37367_c0_g1_i1:52-2334(-)